jgi:hypothetical protein
MKLPGERFGAVKIGWDQISIYSQEIAPCQSLNQTYRSGLPLNYRSRRELTALPLQLVTVILKR